MMQNNPMGAAPGVAPSNPSAVSFQSDPNMRQQFKGFMSGLSNRMAQQSAPAPAPLPMPMPINMQNVDVFQPVQGFANGGGVTFSSGSDYTPGEGISISSATVQGDDTFQGENQSFLNDPYEAEMAQTGQSFLDNFSTPYGSGAAAFAAPTPFSQVSRFTSGGSNTGDALSSALTQAQIDRYDSMPTISQQAGQAQVQLGRDMRMPDGSILSTAPVAGPIAAENNLLLDADTVANLAAQDANLLMTDFGGPEERNRAGMDAIASLMGRDGQQVYLAEDALIPQYGNAALTTITPFQTPDEIFYNDTMMRTDMSPADMGRIQQEKEAQRLSMGGGSVNVDPVTGALSSIPVPISMPSEVVARRDANTIQSSLDQPGFASGQAAGEKVAQGQPSGAPEFDRNTPEFGVPTFDRNTPEFGVSPGSSLPDTVFDAGAFTADEVQSAINAARAKGGDTTTVEAGRGLGARQVFDTKGARAPEDQSFLGALYDTLTGREYPTEEEINQGVIDAQNRQTTATLGFQDPRFGGVAPPVNTPGAVTRSALSQLESRANRQGSGILGALTNFSARNARNMYNDIVTKGYEPIYDNRGQIVATRVPGTNILGRGSVQSRIPGMAGSSTGGSPQLPPVVAQAPEEDAGEKAPPMIELPPVVEPPEIGLPILPEPTKAAEVGNPLQFGYGSFRPIRGINPNLDNAASEFLKLLGGAA